MGALQELQLFVSELHTGCWEPQSVSDSQLAATHRLFTQANPSAQPLPGGSPKSMQSASVVQQASGLRSVVQAANPASRMNIHLGRASPAPRYGGRS